MSKKHPNLPVLHAVAIASSLASLIIFGGCMAEIEPEEEAIGSTAYAVYSDECTDIANCGLNSAQINGYRISELDLSTKNPNLHRVRYLGLVSPGGQSYTLSVELGAMVATPVEGPVLRGDQLVGFRLMIDLDGQIIPLSITAYNTAYTWTKPAQQRVATYGLAYPSIFQQVPPPGGRRGEDELVSACPGHTPGDTTAVVFAGEVYDTERRIVIHNDTPDYPDIANWMSIACTGSAAAKMKLMNYGPQSDFDGHGNSATPEERQATLKMITADYCGTGTSFTDTGTPIYWENVANNVDSPQIPGAIEAVWDENGALCLSEKLRATDYDDVRSTCGAATPPLCPGDLSVYPSWQWHTNLPL